MKRVAKKKASKKPDPRKLIQIRVENSQFKMINQAAKARGMNVTAWSRSTVIDRATADLLKVESQKRTGEPVVGTLPSVDDELAQRLNF